MTLGLDLNSSSPFLVNPDGSPTAAWRRVAQSDWGQKRGLAESEGSGLIREAGKGFARGLTEFGVSAANTLGADQYERALQKTLSENADWYGDSSRKSTGERAVNWAGATFGNYAPMFAAQVGAAALTGGGSAAATGAAALAAASRVKTATRLATMGVSYLQSYGDNKDRLDASLPDMDPSARRGMAAVLSVTQGAIEGMLGAERLMTRELSTRKIINAMLRSAGKTENRAYFESIGRASLGGIKQWGRDAGISGAEEVLEGILQEASMDLPTLAFGGDIGKLDELADKYKQVFIDNALGGALIGSVPATLHALNNLKAQAKITSKTTEQERDEVDRSNLTVNGQVQVDEAKRTNTRFVFEEFKKSLPAPFQGQADIIENLAYKFAYEEHKAGNAEFRPEQMVETLRTAILTEDPAHSKALNDIVESGIAIGLSGEQIESKQMRYMRENMKEASALLHDLQERVELRYWQQDMEQIGQELTKKAAPLNPDEMGVASTKASAAILQPIKAGDVLPSQALVDAFADSPELLKRAYVNGRINGVTFGSKKVDLLINDDLSATVVVGTAAKGYEASTESGTLGEPKAPVSTKAATTRAEQSQADQLLALREGREADPSEQMLEGVIFSKTVELAKTRAASLRAYHMMDREAKFNEVVELSRLRTTPGTTEAQDAMRVSAQKMGFSKSEVNKMSPSELAALMPKTWQQAEADKVQSLEDYLAATAEKERAAEVKAQEDFEVAQRNEQLTEESKAQLERAKAKLETIRDQRALKERDAVKEFYQRYPELASRRFNEERKQAIQDAAGAVEDGNLRTRLLTMLEGQGQAASPVAEPSEAQQKTELKTLQDAMSALEARNPELAQRLAEMRTRQDNLRVAMALRMVPDQPTVLQQGARGQYIPQVRLALFYQGADATTVIHELFHHFIENRLLPNSMMTAMDQAFATKGDDGEPRWDLAAKENAANSFLAFVRDNKPPKGSKVILAFNALKSAVNQHLDDLEQQVMAGGRIGAVLQQTASKMDQEYLKAVEAGDMETAQRMVDEAAKAAGYTIATKHGTDGTFTEFREGEEFYSSSSRRVAKGYGKNLLRGYLKLVNPLVIDAKGATYDDIPRQPLIDRAKQSGNDGVVINNFRDSLTPTLPKATTYIAFDSSQFKLSDAATRDESGNVIHLSQRFDSTSPSILRQDHPSATAGKPLEIPAELRSMFKVGISGRAKDEASVIYGKALTDSMLTAGYGDQTDAGLDKQIDELITKVDPANPKAALRTILSLSPTLYRGAKDTKSLTVDQKMALRADLMEVTDEIGPTQPVGIRRVMPDGYMSRREKLVGQVLRQVAVKASVVTTPDAFTAATKAVDDLQSGDPVLRQAAKKNLEAMGVSKEDLRADVSKKSYAEVLNAAVRNWMDMSPGSGRDEVMDYMRAETLARYGHHKMVNGQKVGSLAEANGMTKEQLVDLMFDDSSLEGIDPELTERQTVAAADIIERTIESKAHPQKMTGDGLFENFRNKGVAFQRWLGRTPQNVYSLIERLVGLNNPNNPLSILAENLRAASNNRTTMLDQINKKWFDQASRLGFEIEMMAEEFDAAGVSMRLTDAASLYAATNGGTDFETVDVQKIIKSETLGDEKTAMPIIKAAVARISGDQKLKALIHWMDDQMRGEYQSVRSIAESIGKDIPLEHEGMYFTHSYKDGRLDPDSADQMLATLFEVDGRNREAGDRLPGPLQARGDVPRGVQMDIDYFSMFARHMRTLAHFETHAQVVHDALSLLQDQKVDGEIVNPIRSAMKNQFGDDVYYNELVRYFKRASRPNNTLRDSPPTGLDAWVSRLRSNMGPAYLAYNPWTAIIQPVSGLHVIGQLPMKHAMTYVKNVAGMIREWRGGQKLGGVKIEDMDVFKFVKKHAPQQAAMFKDAHERSINYGLHRLKGDAFSASGWKIGSLKVGQFIEQGMVPIQTTDAMFRLTAWKTAFEAKWSELSNSAMTDKEIERHARNYANRLVSSTMNPADPHEVPLSITDGGELFKTLMAFSGQPLAEHRAYMREFVVPFLSTYARIRKDTEAGRMEALMKSFASMQHSDLMWKHAWTVMMPGLALGLLSRKRLPTFLELIHDITIGGIYTKIPILGPVMWAHAMYGFDVSEGFSAVGPLKTSLVAFDEALKVGYKAVDPDEDLDTTDYAKLLDGIRKSSTILFGAPDFAPKVITRTMVGMTKGQEGLEAFREAVGVKEKE